MEASDSSLLATALRETLEEIGVNIDSNYIIGELSDLYIPVSNTKVFPFLALINDRPFFQLHETEVLEIVECSVKELLVQDNKAFTKIKIEENIFIQAPYFKLKNKIVWGATAMILNEFKAIWREAFSQ